MKILVAINATNHKTLSDKSLRWVARLGLDLRVFAPKNKRAKYLEAIDDNNYHYYTALDAENTLVTRTDAEDYARQHEYDLLLTIPENLEAWHKRLRFHMDEIKIPYEAIASARGDFSRNNRKRIKRWSNGVIMERLK